MSGRRRIDLLGNDRDTNLVIIELKRNDDSGHMELQAIRYAAHGLQDDIRQAADPLAVNLAPSAKALRFNLPALRCSRLAQCQARQPRKAR